MLMPSRAFGDPKAPPDRPDRRDRLPQSVAASLLSPQSRRHFATGGERFAYDSLTEDLYYDPLGSAPASTPSLVGVLSNAPYLAASNLFFTSSTPAVGRPALDETRGGVIASCPPTRAADPPLDETVRCPLSRRKPGPTYPLLVLPRNRPRLFAGEAFNIVCCREPPCFLLAQRSNDVTTLDAGLRFLVG